MRTNRRRDGGAIAVVASVVLMLVGAFMALALNVGLIMNTRGQLQNASDSAALAGAGSLDGTRQGIVSSVPAMADAYSQAHRAAGESVLIESGYPSNDIIPGHWHFDPSPCVFGSGSCSGFEPLPSLGMLNPASGGYALVQAVKVINGKDGDPNHNPPLNVFFSAFLQSAPQTNVPSSAVAVGRLARAACPLPIGVAACQVIDQNTGEIPCGSNGVTPPRTFVFGNDNADNAGFINITDRTKNPDNAYVRAQIGGGQNCSDNSEIGSTKVTNGNDFNKQVLDELLGMGDNKSCLLNTSGAASPVVDIALVDMGCGNGKWTGSPNVIAFARARIIELCDHQAHAASCVDDNTKVPCTHAGTSGPQDSITMEFLCDAAPGGGGAGKYVRLVQ